MHRHYCNDRDSRKWQGERRGTVRDHRMQLVVEEERDTLVLLTIPFECSAATSNLFFQLHNEGKSEIALKYTESRTFQS
jgi:hypothetical protein